jgi:spore maturation protein CgeB
MKLVVFGLSVSSSWGNGHAVLWRSLIRALAGDGHLTVFFERDVPYYAQHRDLQELPEGRLVLYSDWGDAAAQARRELADADAAFVTSYCPDALPATDLVLDAPGIHAFYDLDTPVTLARLAAGERVDYIPAQGFAPFDLVLSFTGGPAPAAAAERLGARRVAPLYGSVDTERYFPAPPAAHRAGLSYLGTYAADRQYALEMLFLEPAQRRPQERFVIGGSLYPADFPWRLNIEYWRHVAPPEHRRFYAAARATLNVTRQAMADNGWCPSGRLFEAAACGVPMLSDWWDGLDEFFDPWRDIVIVRKTDDVLAALDLSDRELAEIGEAGRARVLAEHTAERRAAELITLLQGARGTRPLCREPERMEG